MNLYTVHLYDRGSLWPDEITRWSWHVECIGEDSRSFEIPAGANECVSEALEAAGDAINLHIGGGRR